MNKSTIFFFLLFTTLQLNAQIANLLDLEQGIVLSTRIDGDDFKLNKGYGVEGGYYFLKKWGKKGTISVDFRSAYAQNETEINRGISGYFSFQDTVLTLISGVVNYKNLSISIPIKYRFQLSEQIPVFLLAGFNVYFNLFNSSNWKYREIQYDQINKVDLSETNDMEESLQHEFCSKDIIPIGFGYKKNNLMLDVYLSMGDIHFDNNGPPGAINRFSIVLNAYYKLN